MIISYRVKVVEKIMTNKTYLFSKESYLHFQKKYTTLIQRINNLYKEINTTIQMDHQSDELSKLYEHYKELKALAKQLEEIAQSIEIIPHTQLAPTRPLQIDIRATITMQFNDGSISKYMIVPYGETNMNHQLISYTHPLAQKLIGQYEGDVFEYNNDSIHIIHVAFEKRH